MKYIIHICVFDLKRNKNFQKFSNTIKHTKRKERIGKVSQYYSRRSEHTQRTWRIYYCQTPWHFGCDKWKTALRHCALKWNNKKCVCFSFQTHKIFNECQKKKKKNKQLVFIILMDPQKSHSGDWWWAENEWQRCLRKEPAANGPADRGDLRYAQ